MTNVNNAANNTENNGESMLKKGFDATRTYIENSITNRNLVITVFGYGVIIGRQADGSYGFAIKLGEKVYAATVKSIKDLCIKFWNWLKECWNAGKAIPVTA